MTTAPAAIATFDDVGAARSGCCCAVRIVGRTARATTSLPKVLRVDG